MVDALKAFQTAARAGEWEAALEAFRAAFPDGRWEHALPALDGTGAITVGTPSARLTVLNFWASWCTACRGEAPDLQRLWRAYGRRVQFIGVDVADHATDARAFQRRFGITYPSGVDPHLAVVSRYGAFGLPFTFVIDYGDGSPT